MPRSHEPTAFDAFPPAQLPQGNSFIDRGHGSFRRESLRRRQSLSSPPPPLSRERSPEPSRSILLAKTFSPERAPSRSNVLIKAFSPLAETHLALGRTRFSLRRALPRRPSDDPPPSSYPRA
ncbi:hypothetical protein T484DRAFT_1746792 [Baffinella frigidus]|nr:hypothetical protein T484DRAFT_1746792 [Cryptophyta sp. CCMP2293]